MKIRFEGYWFFKLVPHLNKKWQSDSREARLFLRTITKNISPEPREYFYFLWGNILLYSIPSVLLCFIAAMLYDTRRMASRINLNSPTRYNRNASSHINHTTQPSNARQKTTAGNRNFDLFIVSIKRLIFSLNRFRISRPALSLFRHCNSGNDLPWVGGLARF